MRGHRTPAVGRGREREEGGRERGREREKEGREKEGGGRRREGGREGGETREGGGGGGERGREAILNSFLGSFSSTHITDVEDNDVRFTSSPADTAHPH